MGDRGSAAARRRGAASLRPRKLGTARSRSPDPRAGRLDNAPVKVLVVDVGGAHVKLLATGRRTPVRFDSGPHLTPSVMVHGVLAATAGWRYDAVTIGYPGPVSNGRPLADPHNLGGGWRRFDFARA